jgi:serine/threonine-protein kinase
MGNPQGKLGQVGDYVDVRLSPTNEAILAASLVDPKTGNSDIWLVDRARPDSPSRLTFGPALNSGPLFSKDGNYIVFRTTRKGGIVEFYKRSAGGGGEEEGVLYLETQLAAGSKTINLVLGDWSHDGGDLLYSVLVSTGYELWKLPFDTRKPVRVTDEKVGMHANLSPDGRFLSYTSYESGQAEVYAQTFPLSNQKWKVSTSGGYEPRWKADSREIYFLSSERKLMYAAVGSGPKPFGEQKVLFQTRIADGVTGYRNHYVPTQDGQSFLVITRIGDPPRPAIEVELNWPAGLKR